MTCTHGDSGTPTHNIWASMRQRCENLNHLQYSEYGGRGITVCGRWKTYSAFLADMGECPYNRSLDRINNNGPYNPENCRWATLSEQQLNQRIGKNNSSGIKGVSFRKRANRWIAYGEKDKKREHYGGDGTLLDACAFRKSWELKNGVPQYD